MAPTHILSVEPACDTAESIVPALETAGANVSVSHVDSGTTALDILEQDSVDCLVTEWALPDTDAPSFLDSVRSRAPNVPIICFTDRLVVNEAFDHGVTDYVYKQGGDSQNTVLTHRVRSALAAADRDTEPTETTAGSGGSKSAVGATETAPQHVCDAVVDESQVGILVFDSEGLISHLNPFAEQLLELPAVDAIGSNCKSLEMQTVEGHPLPLADRPVARVLASGELVVDQIVSLPTSDESRRWLSISASPLTSGDTVEGVVVTLDDVSTEIELETTLETVLNRMTDGFIAFDTDLRLTYFGDQAIRTDRYPHEEYLGATLSELHPHFGNYEVDLREVLETQESKTVETYVPEPTAAWIRARLYPSETGVSVFFRDFTEEKQRERELEQYKTIVESVQDGVCILDSDFEFVVVNEAFAALTGYSKAELLDSNAALITDTEDLATVHDRREKLLAGDTAAAMFNGEITTASGQRVPIEAWMTPLTLLDAEQGTVSVVRDVSFRKDTEARFTALYDAAHDLLSVRSTEEIAAIGVETATAALGFEDAIVFCYNEETNVFEPLAHTPPTEHHFPGMPSISASEASVASQAFFETKLIATTDMSELAGLYDPETPYRRAMFVPLGEHGVLFAGDTETGTIRDQTQTVAELLGATLAAGFSRLSFEQSSQTHRQTVAEQMAELETLTHTTELVSELVEQLFAATTRKEIETAVCSVLTGFDSYRFAWIGAAENRTDPIVPQATSGQEGGYLDWLCEDLAAGGCSETTEPACRALSMNLPVSIDQISENWQTEPWRKEALSRGYQSVLSVPLTYNEINYGVLSVYADAPGAIAGYTETALSKLGQIIAYIIECVETKRGLLADHQTEVELDITDGGTVLHRLATDIETTLTFEGFVPQAEGRSLLYFSATDIPATTVDRAAAGITAIEKLRVITQQNETTLFEATVSGPVLAATLVDCGAVPTRIETDGTQQRVLVTIPQPTDVRTIIERLQAIYPSTTVLSKQDRDHGPQTRETFQMELFDGLTQRQQETLKTAYFAHYFESPRGSTGTEVGQSLGISQPTFNYHLRAALRTLLTMLFEDASAQTLDT
jgi:PAS domain S-box-containing protein